MFTIPNFLLNQDATIALHSGNNAYGDIWESPIAVKCRFEFMATQVIDTNGNEVTSTARVFINTPTVITAESKVVFDGITYTTIIAQKQFAMKTYSHTEISLKSIV